jgi:hypothetical protein
MSALSIRCGISFDCQNETYALLLDEVEGFVNDRLLETSDKSLLVFSRVILSRSVIGVSALSNGRVNIQHEHMHQKIHATLSVQQLLGIVRCEDGISNDAFSEHVDKVLKKREEGKKK